MAVVLADDIFKCTSLYEKDRIQIQISLKLVTKSPNDNKPALVQVMAYPVDWRIYAALGGDEYKPIWPTNAVSSDFFNPKWNLIVIVT